MLPYENATSGERAIQDMQKILHTFGCQSFGQMMDYETGTLLVQFKWNDLRVSIPASVHGYAAAWLRHNPHTYRTRCTKVEHERKAKKIASVAVYSILRDWIKGQVTAIETGMLTFEGAFLGQILLPSGLTVLETVNEQQLLPAAPENKVVSLPR